MDDLLERIQASREEIEAHLQIVHACEIEGELMRSVFYKRISKIFERATPKTICYSLMYSKIYFGCENF